ncbi:uncharacterized protein LOC110443286 [Mizuhopecten yessoensis]|uniref:Uncharacterized protein n=1 Tax=Mizuhopecten yessoensis TaxID=6573 RepID=A0A210PF85_MIZYE|nr:uncharacterized protein LOC110443286 [Mizuhopecten yessoensis]OWF35153.1 hypothetical protein KP79_PYT05412 [Mizuhopecten yessoensis]
MEVSRQLLVIGLIATVGLLMKIIVFTSPGWAGVHVPVKKENPMFMDDMVMPPCDDGSNSEIPEGAPTDQKRPPLPPCDKVMPEKKGGMMPMPFEHRKKDKHHCGPGIHMSLGLWYTVTCTQVSHTKKPAAPTPTPEWIIDRKKRSHHDSSEERDDDDDDDDDDKMKKECHVTSYKHADEVANNLPAETRSLGNLVRNIAMYTDKMLCEFRVEASIGLGMSFLGIIALLVYARGGARSRWSAILSFMSLLTSGVIYLVAVGKVASILIMAHKYLEYEMSDLNVHFSVPWCLIVAVVGALLTLVATFGILLVLSRGHNSRDIAKPYAVNVNENGKYERFVNDDAGPLPLKVKF